MRVGRGKVEGREKSGGVIEKEGKGEMREAVEGLWRMSGGRKGNGERGD